MESFIELDGGNMNKPLKKDNRVYKDAHEASETIHQLLSHVRRKGILWIPESLGIHKGKHIFTYIDGIVPNETPDWLWDNNLLIEVSKKLREWHDATSDFQLPDSLWLLPNDEPDEVICHSDFAPYNCVFKDKAFVGLIDFDVCAPGSRIWDIAYAAYRFIPLMPGPLSPFSEEQMIQRLEVLIQSYNFAQPVFDYKVSDVLSKVQKRLLALSDWSENYAKETNNPEIGEHARMYKEHSEWIMNL